MLFLPTATTAPKNIELVCTNRLWDWLIPICWSIHDQLLPLGLTKNTTIWSNSVHSDNVPGLKWQSNDQLLSKNIIDKPTMSLRLDSYDGCRVVKTESRSVEDAPDILTQPDFMHS